MRKHRQISGIEADFRLIAQQVLAQPESDDPVEI